MKNLVQPILSPHPEPGHIPKKALKLLEFLDLLRAEEDYFSGEQSHTKLMITRLRKIFYDQWGWNSELIKQSAGIEGRYQVSIVDDPSQHGIPEGHAKKVRRYKNNQYQPKHRLITYRSDDRVYGNTRVGEVPFIYQDDHQEVLLPEGAYCDVAHILAGLDAFNHLQMISPLPNLLLFLKDFFPHVNSNADIVTWLGDIASSAGDFLFAYLKTDQPVHREIEQKFINTDAPGSDMLGDIDAYVIGKQHAISAQTGLRVTQILEEYYCQAEQISRKHRYSIFCKAVGLTGWNGISFSNEKEWLSYYKKQLRDNTAFQVFSLTEEKLSSIYLPLRIWLNGYKDILKLELLLDLFLKALKELVKKEPK